MSTLNKSRRQHTRHQSLARQRKAGNSFLAYITAEATRLAAPARVLRDRLRNLGTLTQAQLTAAADLTAAGVPRMVGNPNITIALVTAVTPGNVGFGSRTTAALTFAPKAATTGNVTFASTGSLTGTIVRASGSWTTDGFATGDYIVVRGTNRNNGTYEITNAAALTLTVTKATGESVTNAVTDLLAEVVSTASFFNDGVVTRASGSFITDGFAVGDRVVFQNTGRPELEGFESQITVLSATKMSLASGFVDLQAHVSGASCTVTSTNVITRASGSFITDGFAIGDVILAGGTTGNVGRAAVVKAVAALRIQTGVDFDGNTDDPEQRRSADPVRFAFEAAAGSRTLTGPATLTRASGSWTTDGFVAGDLIRLVGTAQAANARDHRVKAVTSATVLRLETLSTTVAEAATANVGVYRLNEQFGRD